MNISTTLRNAAFGLMAIGAAVMVLPGSATAAPRLAEIDHQLDQIEYQVSKMRDTGKIRNLRGTGNRIDQLQSRLVRLERFNDRYDGKYARKNDRRIDNLQHRLRLIERRVDARLDRRHDGRRDGRRDNRYGWGNNRRSDGRYGWRDDRRGDWRNDRRRGDRDGDDWGRHRGSQR